MATIRSDSGGEYEALFVVCSDCGEMFTSSFDMRDHCCPNPQDDKE